MGLFCRIEQSKILRSAIDRYLRREPMPRLTVPANSLDTQFVMPPNPNIATIVVYHGLAQIVNAIVVLDEIAMVNLLGWPPAIDIEPCQPMRRISQPIYVDVPMPVVIYLPGNITRRYSIASPELPSEHARLGIVIQHFLQAILRYTQFPLFHAFLLGV
jgi:hypothetical protein